MPFLRLTAAAAALLLLAASPPARADESGDDDAGMEARIEAGRRISWAAEAGDDEGDRGPGPVRMKLLGFNDFHGHLAPGTLRVNGKVVPVGGAAVLATYLKQAQAGNEGNTIIVHAGDHVGASPAESALLADEPSIQFLNLLANEDCSYEERTDPDCNIVGTTGNHEYDQGYREMFRLIYGGNSPKGPFLENPWRGARYPMVVSNVVFSDTGAPLLPPYVVKEVGGVPVAFIGAVLRGTPSIVSAAGIQGLSFLDEATAINKWVKVLQREGIHAFVVTIHQGGFAKSYTGATDPSSAENGEIVDIVRRLDDDVDVVVSGHTHSFTNALVANQNGKQILVTQAFSYGTAYADIDLSLDRRSRDVVAKSASIVTTFGTRPDGTPVPADPAVDALVKQAQTAVAPLVNRVIGTTTTDLLRAQTAAGESNLGDLIADAQRAQMATDFAFMNPGGIRGDLLLPAPGQPRTITWGDLFTVQPFGNSLVKMTLTYAQLKTLLEQQFDNPAAGQSRMLQISGLTYVWDAAQPTGSKIVELRKGGVLLDPTASYTVAVNSFLASGGDRFGVLSAGTNRVGGPLDLDALIAYVQAHTPLSATVDGRIARLH